MARVFQRKGAWFTDIVVDGRRIKKRVGTEKEARKRLGELEAVRVNRKHGEAIMRAMQPHAKNLTAAELTKRYTADVEARGAPAKTVRGLRRDIGRFVAAIGAKRVQDVTVAAATRYIADCRERKLSAKTINNHLTAVKAMLSWGVRQETLSYNPLEKFKKVDAQEVRDWRPLTDEEVERLLENSPEDYARMWHAIIWSGLRHTQFVGLTWGDVSFKRRAIRIVRKASKNKKRAEEWVPMLDEFERVIRERLTIRKNELGIKKNENPDRNETVFLNGWGRPWRNNLLQRFYTCCEHAGIEHHRVREKDGVVEVACLHGLRKNMACLLADNNVPVKVAQLFMQHATAAMTEDLYQRVRTTRPAAIEGLKGPKKAPAGKKTRARAAKQA